MVIYIYSITLKPANIKQRNGVLIQAVPGDYTKWKNDKLGRSGKAAARLNLPMPVLWKAIVDTEWGCMTHNMQSIIQIWEILPNPMMMEAFIVLPDLYHTQFFVVDLPGKKKLTDIRMDQLISTLLLKKRGDTTKVTFTKLQLLFFWSQDTVVVYTLDKLGAEKGQRSRNMNSGTWNGISRTITTEEAYEVEIWKRRRRGIDQSCSQFDLEMQEDCPSLRGSKCLRLGLVFWWSSLN